VNGIFPASSRPARYGRGYVQCVRGLLRGQHRVQRHDLDAGSLLEEAQNLGQHYCDLPRHHKRLIVSDLGNDVDWCIRWMMSQVLADALSCALHELEVNILRSEFDSLRAHCTHSLSPSTQYPQQPPPGMSGRTRTA
jgi:hypothetical protein